jgi:lipopolysaccharide exporter
MSVSLPLAGPQPQERDTSLGDSVRKGALWAGGSTLFLRFANIAIMAVVARIIAPRELGVFALTLVIHAVVVSLAELGVSSAIARSDVSEEKIAPTVVTISILSSLTLASLMAAFAEPIAIALGSADAAAPLRVMALCVAMIGPFAVPGAQLQRDFRQDLVFRANAISFIPSTAVLVIVALLGDGAMAFAWSRVIGQLVMGTLMFLSTTRRYWPGFSAKVVGPLLRFGLPLALANLLSQVLLNVDYVIVGRTLDITDVGLYTLAFNVSMWSTAVIGSMLNGVVIPAFSRVKAAGGDLAVALGTATRSVALVAFPIGAVSLGLAAPLITTIYGAKWGSAAPVLGVLAVYGVMSVICLLLANVIIASGHTSILFIVQAVALALLVPIMLTGVTIGGLVGVGVAHIVIVLLVTFPVYVVAVRRSIGVGPVVILRAMAWPLVAAAAAGGTGWLVSLAVPIVWLQLLLGGLAAGVVYLLLAAPMLAGFVSGDRRILRGARRVLDAAGAPARWVGRHTPAQPARPARPARAEGTP